MIKKWGKKKGRKIQNKVLIKKMKIRFEEWSGVEWSFLSRSWYFYLIHFLQNCKLLDRRNCSCVTQRKPLIFCKYRYINEISQKNLLKTIVSIYLKTYPPLWPLEDRPNIKCTFLECVCVCVLLLLCRLNHFIFINKDTKSDF